MYNIYLAIGNEQLEMFLQKYKPLIESKIKTKVDFVEATVYREAVISAVKDYSPDLLILRESLQGQISMSELIYNIRVTSPKTRILFISSDRVIGDAFLASLVQMGIYDIIIGNQINANELLKKIIYPNKFSDVVNLVPKTTVDEKTNKVIFEAPVNNVPQNTVEETGLDILPQKKPKEELLTPLKPISQTFNDIEKPQKKSLFGKKVQTKTIKQQVITFIGGSSGVGTSQIAFNTAITMANQGYNVLYLDLNKEHASIDTIFQLGLEDIGLDTVLNNFVPNDITNIEKAINTTTKLLQVIDKRNFLYKSYTRLPANLNFMFFSQLYMNGDVSDNLNVNNFRDLIMTFLRELKYDLVILDAPANTNNILTQIAIAYANKVFSVIAQDNSIIANMIKNSKILENEKIDYKEKTVYLINRFEKCEFTTKNIYTLISGNLNYDKFSLLTIPNLNIEFIQSIFNALPIVLTTKNKEFQKTMMDIKTLIEA